MSRETVARWRLFWIFVRDQGTCSACGKEVSPDEASTDRSLPSSPRSRDELDKLHLVHAGCKS